MKRHLEASLLPERQFPEALGGSTPGVLFDLEPCSLNSLNSEIRGT